MASVFAEETWKAMLRLFQEIHPKAPDPTFDEVLTMLHETALYHKSSVIRERANLMLELCYGVY